MSTESKQSDEATKKKGKQDTPGRPKPGSSRQQTQPGQATQTGSPEIDSKSARGTRDPKKPQDDDITDDADYRDRPSDDGKHGDAQREPNEGFPRR